MPIRREESRKAKLISTAIIGFVMLSSIIGFSFSQIAQIGFDTNPEQKFSYGNLKLTAGQNSYSGEIDGKTYEFLYRPEELASVDADELAQTLKSSVQVYTTSDAQSRLAGQFSAAQFDFARAIAPNILEIGFTEENPFGKQIVSCANATEFVPVVHFNFTNTTTEISKEGNCVIVNAGSERDFARLRDKTMYALLEAK